MGRERTSKFIEHEIEWDDDKVSRLWDYYSRTPPYSEIYFSKIFGRQILRQSGLPLKRELDVLDFGCGPGFLWQHIKQLGARWHYTGLDFSSDSLDQTTIENVENNKFAGLHKIKSLPSDLDESSFDAVLLIEVIEHLSDEHLNATIKEIFRLLRQGGVVVISTPNEEELSLSKKMCPECGAIFHEFQHVRNWSGESLQKYLLKHGFRMRKINTLDFNAKGKSLRSLFARLKRVIKRWLFGVKGNPHMLAVFQKV